MQLSKPQEEAVKTIEGQVILISCPGSGKTSTVVRRVQYMVEQGIPSDQILVLTFSRAAANEMKSRFLKLMPEGDRRGENALFATIHSFCFNIIAHAYNLNVSNILNENEGWMIIRKGIEALKRKNILKMEIRDYADFTSNCLREISVINNNGVDWNTYKAESCPTSEFRAIYELYEEQKHSIGKIDYDDMLKMCYKLLLENEDYLFYYKRKFRYIIVDEYQDTNFLQRDILYLLAGTPEEANICVVGDDDQSIYKFRGAKPEIMLSFQNSYPSCKQIYMDTNYRSEPCIINQAKRLIEHNKTRFSKNINAFKTGAGITQELPAKTSEKEVFNIVDKLRTLHEEKKMVYEEMAVLFRNNKQASFLSLMLMKRNIPFHSNDQIQSPYNHWIFHDIVAYYKLAIGAGTGHDLVQVINKPNRFIPIQGIYKIGPDERKISQNIYYSKIEPWKKRKAVDEVHDFFYILKRLKEEVDSPKDFLKELRIIGGYDAYLKSYSAYRNMDKTELTGILDSYLSDINENKISTMEEWMEYAKEVNTKIESINKSRNKVGVTISTMHKSKGLEWDVVFILGANEGVIPSPKVAKLGDIEEERRLFYVAATRARKELYISYTENEMGKKSIFVTEFFGNEVPQLKKDTGKKKNFTKGQKVIHSKYGKGTIVQIQKEKVDVKFDNHVIIRSFAKNQLYQLKQA